MARVSKKTRSRRRPAPAEDPGTLVERMVGALWRAVAAGDLLRAELEAATCMALPRVGRLAPQDAQAFISKVLVDEAIRQPSADGAAMLRLLMALGSPATKKSASQALARLTEAGIYPPDWVTGAGRAVPDRAWRRYDVFGDDEAIAVTFRYGEAEHGIVGQLDLTGIPVAIAVGVAVDAASLIEAIGREDDPFHRTGPVGGDPGVPARGAIPGPAPARRGRFADARVQLRGPRGGGGRLPEESAGRRGGGRRRGGHAVLGRGADRVQQPHPRRAAGPDRAAQDRAPAARPRAEHLQFVCRAAPAPRAGGDRVDPLVGRVPRPGRGGHRPPGRKPPGGVRPVRAGLRRPGL